MLVPDRYGCFQKLGAHFGSPENKDHNIFGSILGPPMYGSPQISIIKPVYEHGPAQRNRGQGTWNPAAYGLSSVVLDSRKAVERPMQGFLTIVL